MKWELLQKSQRRYQRLYFSIFYVSEISYLIKKLIEYLSINIKYSNTIILFKFDIINFYIR